MTLAASQAAATGSGSVTEWDTSTNVGSVSITTRQATHLFAPSAVWLEADNVQGLQLSTNGGSVYDPAFHELTFVWKVRGEPLGTFNAPQNMVDGWNNPNVMYGQKVAFYFPDAGTYTIDLEVIDANNDSAVAETTVEVRNETEANNRYPGTRTVCFSSSGDFTGAPQGAKLVTVSSGNDINNETTNFIASPTRFLFRRDDTFNEVTMFVRNSLEYVGAFGPGARPIVNERAAADQAIFKTGDGAQHTITGLDCRGSWDSTTETGNVLTTGPLFFRSTSNASKVLVSDCIFDGFDLIETTIGSGSANGSIGIFADCTLTNWKNYGFFHNTRNNTKYQAIIGCRVAQHVDALNGGDRNNRNAHGPIRISRCTNTVFAQLDLFSRCGWSGLAPDFADQPCIRLNSDPNGPGNLGVMDRIVAEGGFRIISLEGQNNSEQEYAGNYLMDRMLLIGTAKTAATFIRLEFGGTTVRNVIGIMPDVPEYHNNWVGAFHLNINIVNSTNQNAPVRIHNNTFLNLQSDANDKANGWPIWAGQPFTNMTAENNVLHAPNIGAGARTEDGPLDLSTPIGGVTPRYRGVRYNGDATMNGVYESPSSLPLPRPQGTSDAIDDGDNGLKAYLDFMGAPRPTSNNERGALLEG